MSTAHDLPPQTNTEQQIPTQETLKGPILDAIPGGEDMEAIPSPLESLDEEGLRTLRGRIDRKEMLNGTNIVIAILEQLGEIPYDTDAEGTERRQQATSHITNLEYYFHSNFYIDSTATPGLRIDVDLVRKLYDATEQARTPLLQSITGAQNSRYFTDKHRSVLIEADRIARLRYLDEQGNLGLVAREEKK